MMLGLLTFTIFNCLMTISLEVLFFEKNSVCFQKWSRLRIVPFPSVRRARDEKMVTRNPALNCWCSVSRHIKIKIETDRLSPESGKRKKVNIQILSPRFRSQQFFLSEISGYFFLTQIQRDMLVLRAFHELLEISKKVSSYFSKKLLKKKSNFLLKHCEIRN